MKFIATVIGKPHLSSQGFIPEEKDPKTGIVTPAQTLGPFRLVLSCPLFSPTEFSFEVSPAEMDWSAIKIGQQYEISLAEVVPAVLVEAVPPAKPIAPIPTVSPAPATPPAKPAA